MHRDLTDAAAQFYEELTGQAATVVDDVPAAHGFPTLETGVPCGEMATSFLNACAAGGRLLAQQAMNKYVLLLRGINVGGHDKLPKGCGRNLNTVRKLLEMLA